VSCSIGLVSDFFIGEGFMAIYPVLLDGLESDLDNLTAINQLITHYGCSIERLREIPFFTMRPSKDIAEIAVNFACAILPFIRYLTHGL
jgi:hypothetical protein